MVYNILSYFYPLFFIGSMIPNLSPFSENNHVIVTVFPISHFGLEHSEHVHQYIHDFLLLSTLFYFRNGHVTRDCLFYSFTRRVKILSCYIIEVKMHFTVQPYKLQGLGIKR